MEKPEHIHIIDGKRYAYPDDACPFCKPESVTKQPVKPTPTVYTKGKTIVVKFSKASMLTVTYWTKGGVFLVGMNEIARGADGKLMRDSNGTPIWKRMTRRLPVSLAKDLAYQLGALAQSIEAPQTVPRRE